MCVGVHYTLGSREMRVLFASSNAQLPVHTKDGITLMPWGRRPKQAGKLPLGGCAYLDGIHAGNWERFRPRGVRLWVRSFAEQDVEGRVHWHALTAGKWIKGLLAQEGAERRVYVVTLTPVLAETPYERWPCIQSG
ncbi:MAG: hypothetical protein KGJ08_00140 [Gammaproteobacteria bacterium]|nr:hypothetical protein [Gammaproteobacteria bacterium]